MKWIAEFPSTNGKIVIGLFLATVYIVTALVADMMNRELSETTHIAVGAFLAALIGISTYQYKVKRETHVEHASPPAKPDVEDAPAMAPDRPDIDSRAVRIERPSAINVRDALRQADY